MHAISLNWCVTLAVLALLAVSSTTATPPNDGKLARREGARRMTNAKRLARGLTPNKPVLRRSPRQQRRGTSATVTTTSSSTTTPPPPPPTPSCTPGVIKVHGIVNGYLNNGGQGGEPYLIAVTDISEAGAFCLDNNGSPDGPLNFEATNYDTTAWPAGLSLAVTVPLSHWHSWQFGGALTVEQLELGATTQPLETSQTESFTSVGEQFVESAIWYLDPSTNNITAQWVDPNTRLYTLGLAWYTDYIGVYYLSGPGAILANALTLEWSST